MRYYEVEALKEEFKGEGKYCYLILNGRDSNLKKEMIDGDLYCTDGGGEIAYNLNLLPRGIIGDMDSISKGTLDYFLSKGVKIKRHSPIKDATDGELSIEYLVEKGYKRIFILGGLGGRTDHMLGNIFLLKRYKEIVFVDEDEIIFKVDKEMGLQGNGETISFMPLSESVKLTLDGFLYPLDNYRLELGSSRCISNKLKGKGRIQVVEGDLVALVNKD